MGGSPAVLAPIPVLLSPFPSRVSRAGQRMECVCGTRQALLACGAKPSSRYRWCLAVFPSEWDKLCGTQTRLVVLSHLVCVTINLGYLRAFWVLLHVGAHAAVTLVPGSCSMSSPPAAWLSIPRAISSPALLPVVLLS